MSLVAPFRALHYQPNTIGNLSDLITPPYDVISPEEASRFRSRSPYNFAHIILPQKPDEDYTKQAAVLQHWKKTGILSSDPVPSYYLYQQTFTVDGISHQRRTLMASVQLHDFKDGIIRPHENTHGKHKADRLQLLRQSRTNLSHIFAMVKDAEGALQSAFERWMFHPPYLKAVSGDGIEHVLWREEGTKAEALTNFFENKPLYIVDGHHRYESSVMYAREQNALGDPSHPASRGLFAIANVFDPALVVFPTHRLVKSVPWKEVTRERVEKAFSLSALDYDELKSFLKSPHELPRFGLFAWGQLFLATPRDWKSAERSAGKSVAKLSVYWSDEGILKNMCGIEEQERSTKITYDKSPDSLWEKRTPTDLIVFHAPPAIVAITDVADESKYMPQKSTYFYPKLWAGLTMRELL